MGHRFFLLRKNGLCVNYRVLNKNMILDSYPLPHNNELLSRLQGAKYSSIYMMDTSTSLLLDFVTPWHILAYNFQTVHILIVIS